MAKKFWILVVPYINSDGSQILDLLKKSVIAHAYNLSKLMWSSTSLDGRNQVNT